MVKDREKNSARAAKTENPVPWSAFFAQERTVILSCFAPDLNVQQLSTALIKNLQYHGGMLQFISSLHTDLGNHRLSVKR